MVTPSPPTSATRRAGEAFCDQRLWRDAAVGTLSDVRRVRRLLEPARHHVSRSLVGNFVTSLDMAGCSVTVSMVDEEMKRLWDAPVHAPALRWGM
jgi:hypothetical protein